MTSIRGCRRPCWEHISEGPSGFSPPSESSHDETPVNSPAKPLVAKYTKKDLQKIFKTVFKAQAPSSDDPCEKSLKARSLDVYRDKFHMECYNFCQQCKDHFATAGVKGPNRIFFATSFLRDCINFCWQQYKRKYKGKTTIYIT